MAASVFDSPLYAHLFPAGDAGRLFSDSAALRAMLLVEGALAKVQGARGIIPAQSAAAIHRASLEIQIDPGAIARQTGSDGVAVPALLAAFRGEMNAPEHAQYVHWGATSQDIIDTGLMLRLRQCLALAEEDLRAIIAGLAAQAAAHADLVMPARTYNQQATPTSWGAVLAGWGMGAIDALEELETLRKGALFVSLSGASGTASALGENARGVRADLARALGLGDPERSWHTDRAPILRIADWMGRNSALFGGAGHTLIDLAATGIGEITLAGAGGSSTMPQKQNPVSPSALVALGHHMTGLRAGLAASGMHQHQRDGAAWFSEWLLVPQICLGHASMLAHMRALTQNLRPNADAMGAAVTQGLGLVHAEALSFALTAWMSRVEAQTATKVLCQTAMQTQTPLIDLAQAQYPELDTAQFAICRQLGQAPFDTAAFVARAGRLD